MPWRGIIGWCPRARRDVGVCDGGTGARRTGSLDVPVVVEMPQVTDSELLGDYGRTIDARGMEGVWEPVCGMLADGNARWDGAPGNLSGRLIDAIVSRAGDLY